VNHYLGEDRSLEKKNYPPGQHGNTKRRAKKSEYAIQLMEKQTLNILMVFLKSSLETYMIRLIEEKVLQVSFFYSYVNPD